MRKITRISTILLVIVMALTNCNQVKVVKEEVIDDSTIPTLHVVTMGSSSIKASERISEVLSRITLEKIGCRISIEQQSLTDYPDTLNHKLLFGEVPDIFIAYEQGNLISMIQNGDILPLQELLEPYDGLSQSIQEEDWDSTTIGGNIYAIPANLDKSNALGFMMRKDICDELEIDTENIHTLNDLFPVLKKVKQAYPELEIIVPHFSWLTATLGQDSMGDDIGVLLHPSKGSTIVENLYASEEYYNFSKTMYQWYQEGLILENAFMNTESRTFWISAGLGFGYFAKINRYALSDAQAQNGCEMVFVKFTPSVKDNSTNNRSWCISSESEYPKLAMAFLNMLFLEEEIVLLSMHGEEGKDYKIEGNRIKYPLTEGPVSLAEQYSHVPWMWPGRELLDSRFYDENLLKIGNEQIFTSPAMGFMFDSSKVQNEMDLCKKVIKKYSDALLCGYLDPDESIPMFLQELQNSGIDKVIDEKQKQFDTWLKIKN